MNPLTAFSLACGVIQVLDFSIKTVVKCRELYREGSSSEYQELEELAKHLVCVRSELNLPSASRGANCVQQTDEPGLLELAGQCSATADQLVKKLHSLKIDGPHKKRQAVLKIFRQLWEKGEMEEIQKRLDGYRNALDTQILINLRLSQRPQSFEELKDAIQVENERTRGQVRIEFQEHERRLAEEEYRKRFLNSLWFAEIHSREETIAEAHSKTFEWIFDESGRAVRPWNNFLVWLQSGEGIYWISGKAGSGKSTLMNFLCQNERTTDALTIWSGGKDIFTPKFFFWSGGTTMQKSFDGLLRSLLWQIFNKFPEKSLLSADVGSVSKQNRWFPQENGSIGAWTKPRLQKTLQAVIGQLQSSCRLCFLIDGLDEFGEDEDDLVTFAQNLVSSNSVKVCLSSRPYKSFEDAFAPSAKLRLQDLTYKDIQRYVNDKFHDVPQLKSMMLENEYEMDNLKREIVSRAKGVFLWVSLAVKDQIRGLKNEDRPETLQERLACLPSEIEGMYLRMLLQIDKPYRSEASRFLQMALHRPGLSLLRHALASREDLENMILSHDNVSNGTLNSLCQSTQKRIIATCAGLLEVNKPPTSDTKSETISEWSDESDPQQLDADVDTDPSFLDCKVEISDECEREEEMGQPSPEPDDNNSFSDYDIGTVADKALDLRFESTVDFVHRTAVDFLRDSGPGVKFLEDNGSPDFKQVLYVKALIGEARFRGFSDGSGRIQDIDVIMKETAFAERRTETAQTELCELVDRSMSILDRKRPDWRPDSHWCTRWSSLMESYSQKFKESHLRSSSTDSFYSAESDPKTQRNSNYAPTSSCDILPFNFFGYAASQGLYRYVQHELDTREGGFDLEKASYLLCCLIPTFDWEYDSDPDPTVGLRLIADLLRRGGNPNTRVFSFTIWTQFLERAFSSFEHYRFHSSGSDDDMAERLSDFSESIAVFVEQGADVGAILNVASIIPIWCMLGWFEMQISALSVIAMLLERHPQYRRIQEMCIARGALLYSRCTTLRFNFTYSADARRDGLDWRSYELSEQESKEFLKLWEQYRVMCTKKCSFRLGVGAYMRSRIYDWINKVCPQRSSLDPSISATIGASSATS